MLVSGKSKITNGVVSEFVQIILEGIFYFRYIVRFHCSHLRVIINTSIRKVQPFPAPIFTKFFNIQEGCIKIYYTEIHPSRKINMQIQERVSLGSKVQYVLHCDDFHKTAVTEFIFMLISFSDVYINYTKNVANCKI